MHIDDHPRGFTLMETLIVVALVALLAVGIAGIFGTVGETITRGRRVSELNRSAAQIERVMRGDFDRMSREGFLVIRNEYANRGRKVTLFDPAIFEGEPNQRARRIDEILFFAHNETGVFETARTPMHPDLIARSNTARIYYGHGKEWIRPIVTATSARQLRSTDSYFRPALSNVNPSIGPIVASALGYDASGDLSPGQRNPNQYAADWTVLRHVMPMMSPQRLLSSASVAEMDIPDVFVADMGFDRRLLLDSPVQTAMQPSAQSVFLHLARQEGGTRNSAWGPPNGYRVDARLDKPLPTSGLVDIVVTDFAEIASIVNHAAIDGSGGVYWPEDINRFNPPAFGDVFNPLSPSDREHMKAWMLDAMPGNRKNEIPGLWAERPRIRYESEPPLLTIEDDFLQETSDARKELERAYRESDQVMLTSSVFVPRCTEFIVEWSYGLIDQFPGSPTRGQMIWYGLPRYNDVNDNGDFDGATDVIVAQPYGNPATTPLAMDVLPGLTGQRATDFGANDLYPTRDLINWSPNPPTTTDPSDKTEVSMFGYYDPGPGQVGVGGGPVGFDPDDRSWDSRALEDPSQRRPWLWPALIRVTITIADRTDPTIETTHQIVFEVPQGGLDNK